jgi:UTP:GlnB (protein PII) uridylyltransferase
MKTLLFALLFLSALAYAGDTGNPASIQKDEIWWSTPRLERIAVDYVAQHHIDFAFDNTKQVVVVEMRGTNSVAEIWFSSPGKPTLLVEIAQSGEVIKTHLSSAVVVPF